MHAAAEVRGRATEGVGCSTPHAASARMTRKEHRACGWGRKSGTGRRRRLRRACRVARGGPVFLAIAAWEAFHVFSKTRPRDRLPGSAFGTRDSRPSGVERFQDRWFGCPEDVPARVALDPYELDLREGMLSGFRWATAHFKQVEQASVWHRCVLDDDESRWSEGRSGRRMVSQGPVLNTAPWSQR